MEEKYSHLEPWTTNFKNCYGTESITNIGAKICNPLSNESDR